MCAHTHTDTLTSRENNSHINIHCERRRKEILLNFNKCVNRIIEYYSMSFRLDSLLLKLQHQSAHRCTMHSTHLIRYQLHLLFYSLNMR